MHENPIRRKIARGVPVIGPLLQEIPDSLDLVEFVGAAGFDYVIVDVEHAGTGIDMARDVTRAAEAAGICTLARVPSTEPGRILALLDSGVQGIILAHCNSAADAEALVRAVKYPPRGIRGASTGSRAARYGYGAPPRELIGRMDQETLCIGLIEEPGAVDAVDAMLAVDGFDGCFLGAGDMSLAMGREYFGHVPAHPAVSALIDRVRTDTLAAGKLVMEPAGSGEAAQRIIGLGVQIVVLQFGQFLRSALDAYLSAARGNGSER
ncbi:MAG TPA: aldolase/citrate lyase family protein [Candidatus Limnocylindrales bacterium]|nr:aldolase/citrate lyase family protein [Candidatus Limnocylindrales bacterium]